MENKVKNTTIPLYKSISPFLAFFQIKNKLILNILLFLFLASCEKPLENPEMSDRIYNDLLAESKNMKAAADTEKKALEDIEKDIKTSAPGDNQVKNKYRKKYESQAKIEKLEEKSRYYNLRAISRKDYVLQNYPLYFKEKKSWPDMEEWEDYQTSKKLQNSPRDWDKHVPKLGRRIKEYNDKAAAMYGGGGGEKGAKKEEGGGEKKAEGEKKE